MNLNESQISYSKNLNWIRSSLVAKSLDFRSHCWFQWQLLILTSSVHDGAAISYFVYFLLPSSFLGWVFWAIITLIYFEYWIHFENLFQQICCCCFSIEKKTANNEKTIKHQQNLKLQFRCNYFVVCLVFFLSFVYVCRYIQGYGELN